LFNFIKDTFNKTIIDLENPKILKTLIYSFLVTTIIAVFIFIFFYYFLFSSLFNLSDPSNFNEDGMLYYFFSLKIFPVLLSIIQFFTSWILISLILVPIGSIISGLFAEKIFFDIKETHNYKWEKKLKKNAFYLSNKFAIIAAIKSFLINILILPLYLLLPIANIFIFVIVNGLLIGREFCGNFLIQFFEKDKIKLINLHLDNKIYILGIFVVVLYTIPFVNLLAPTIANLLFSHLILQSNKSIFK
jgi:hypothetical protein